MVEVVQDFLHYVQSGFDVSRDAKAEVEETDCCLLAADATDPAKGRTLKRMKELLFNEVLDVDFGLKTYELQLAEFSLKGQRILPQIDVSLADIQKMIQAQPHCQSPAFLPLLEVVTKQLHQALCLMQQELLEVWRLQSPPFFYPAKFLDLKDSFLTAKLLSREAARYVDLLNTLQLFLDEVPKAELEATKQHVELLKGNAPPPPKPEGEVSALQASRRSTIGLVAGSCLGSAPMAQRLIDYATHKGLVHALVFLPDRPLNFQPRLQQAMQVFEAVLVHALNDLHSDMNRTMYRVFNRMVFCYVRWRRHFRKDDAVPKRPSVLQDRAQTQGLVGVKKPPKKSVFVGDKPKKPKGAARASVKRSSIQNAPSPASPRPE